MLTNFLIKLSMLKRNLRQREDLLVMEIKTSLNIFQNLKVKQKKF